VQPPTALGPDQVNVLLLFYRTSIITATDDAAEDQEYRANSGEGQTSTTNECRQEVREGHMFGMATDSLRGEARLGSSRILRRSEPELTLDVHE
jgi:hypothetical protein